MQRRTDHCNNQNSADKITDKIRFNHTLNLLRYFSAHSFNKETIYA